MNRIHSLCLALSIASTAALTAGCNRHDEPTSAGTPATSSTMPATTDATPSSTMSSASAVMTTPDASLSPASAASQ